MRTWRVYLHAELVREVEYPARMSQPEVYRALVECDGYSPAIVVRAERCQRG